MNAQKVPWMVSPDAFGERRLIYTRTHPTTTFVANCRTAALARLIVSEHNAILHIITPPDPPKENTQS